MISVDRNIAAAFLEPEPFKYLFEIPIFRKELLPGTKVFGDTPTPSALFILQGNLDKEFYHTSGTLVGYDEQFWGRCIRWLYPALTRLTISSLDERAFDHPDLHSYFQVGPVSSAQSFVCTDINSVPEFSIPIVTLTEDDCSAVERYVMEPDPAFPLVPEFTRVYEITMGNPNREILAIKEDDEIIGFVAFVKGIDNFWGVTHIDVQSDRRGRGLATQLAAAYARSRLLLGDIPLYELVMNPASVQVAIKAGFTCCRTHYRAECERRSYEQVSAMAEPR